MSCLACTIRCTGAECTRMLGASSVSLHALSLEKCDDRCTERDAVKNFSLLVLNTSSMARPDRVLITINMPSTRRSASSCRLLYTKGKSGKLSLKRATLPLGTFEVATILHGGPSDLQKSHEFSGSRLFRRLSSY